MKETGGAAGACRERPGNPYQETFNEGDKGELRERAGSARGTLTRRHLMKETGGAAGACRERPGNPYQETFNEGDRGSCGSVPGAPGEPLPGDI